MENANNFPYHFIVKSFNYNGNNYKVVLTPELYPDDDGPDFTGNYIGILISSNKGTKPFELERDELMRWQSIPKGMDPGLIDILDIIIKDSRKL